MWKRRVVYIVETKNEKDAAMETVKSLFAARPKDFISAVDVRSIIIVKELRDEDTNEDMEQTARMLVDMLNAEAMSQVRVSIGNPVHEINGVSRSYKGSQDGSGSRKDFLHREECDSIQQSGYRTFDLSASGSAL